MAFPLPRRTSHLLVAPGMMLSLAVSLAACGPGGEQEERQEPRSAEEDGGSEEDEVEALELPTEVENDGWRGQRISPETDPHVDGPYQFAIFHDDEANVNVSFEDVAAAEDGVEIQISVVWPPLGERIPLQHDQFFVEFEGQHHTTDGEGELVGPPGDGELDIVNEATVRFPDAPDSGALFLRGPDYEAEGSGLPPIGVCYQVGSGFDDESCTG